MKVGSLTLPRCWADLAGGFSDRPRLGAVDETSIVEQEAVLSAVGVAVEPEERVDQVAMSRWSGQSVNQPVLGSDRDLKDSRRHQYSFAAASSDPLSPLSGPIATQVSVPGSLCVRPASWTVETKSARLTASAMISRRAASSAARTQMIGLDGRSCPAATGSMNRKA